MNKESFAMPVIFAAPKSKSKIKSVKIDPQSPVIDNTTGRINGRVEQSLVVTSIDSTNKIINLKASLTATQNPNTPVIAATTSGSIDLVLVITT